MITWCNHTSQIICESCQEENRIEALKDRLAAVEQERDKLKQQLMTISGRLLEVGKERDEYKDEFIELATAYWELRRVVKWYLDMLDAQFNPKDLDSVRMTKDGIDEFNKIVVNSEKDLRETVE